MVYHEGDHAIFDDRLRIWYHEKISKIHAQGDQVIQSQNIHSLSDFQRNTAAHVRSLRESGLPKVLTVKGRAELVVQTADAYQALLTRLEVHESAIAINRGLRNIAEGKSTSLAEFGQRMRSKLMRAEQEV